MTRFGFPRFVGLLTVALSVPAGAQVPARSASLTLDAPESDPATTVYRLTGDATYAEGCVEPCDCLMLLGESFRGTMELGRLRAGDDGIARARVMAVNWLATSNGEERRIVGHGLLEIGSPNPLTVIQTRLTLELRIDGAWASFDSGWVMHEGPLGLLNVRLDEVDAVCFGREIHVAARPVPERRIVAYELDDDSTFSEGCVEPCLCPISLAPARGRFGLVDLGPPSDDAGAMFNEWALVRVHWITKGTAFTTPDTLSGVGAGIYRVFDGLGPLPAHRLQVDLRLTSDEPDQPVAFDSGWIAKTFGIGARPPIFQIAVAENGFYCFDRIWEITARPRSSTALGRSMIRE